MAPVRQSVEALFMRRVSPEPNTGCWLWTGALCSAGYAKGYDGVKAAPAYKVAYALFNGPVPAGLEIDHQCFNRVCVNPSHLKAMTRQENAKRRQINQTHCKHGHEFTSDNTYVDPRGWRQCRTCRVTWGSN